MTYYYIRHEKEYGGCGKPGIRVLRKPIPLERVRVEDLRHLDGTAVYPGEEARCDSCGQIFKGFLRVASLVESETPLHSTSDNPEADSG